MDSSIRAQRYEQLWDAGTTSVRRVALGGVIFAALVLLKVVAPYEKKEVLEETLLVQTSKAELVRSKLEKVAVVEQELDKIEQVVLNAPWSDAKDELEQFFRQGGGDERARANKTVRDIAALVRAAIVDPLRDTIRTADMTDELARLPNMVDEAIEEWVDGKIDTKWYFRRAGKESAVQEVQDILKELREQAKEIIGETKKKVSAQTTALKVQFTAEETEIQKITEDIEQAMSDALPSWAGKLISAQTMVLIYPWLLVGIAMYFVGRAVFASRYFHGMADEKGWTAEERSDPLLSSMWTLTARGTLGTAITMAAYLTVLVSLWYCLYLSQQYAQVEVISRLLEQGQIGSEKQSNPLWIGHVFMVLLVAIALILPWRGRVKS